MDEIANAKRTNMKTGNTIDSSLLDILAVTSDNYKEVFSFWESSLALLHYPHEKQHVVDLGQLKQPFGYCTDSWRGAIDRQLKAVVSWIRDHFGEYFLHTDTDIQFFPRFLSVQVEWLQWMAEQSIDMLFMRERTNVFPERRVSEVNAGFYVVHCNSRTLRFWEKVMSDELSYPKMDGYPPYTDQYHLNRGLNYCRGPFPQEGCFGVRWAVIPDYHCIWSEPESDKEVSCAAFHHAVNTKNKPELLQRVRRIVLSQQTLPSRISQSLASIQMLRNQLAQLRTAYGARSYITKTVADVSSRYDKLVTEASELASVTIAQERKDGISKLDMLALTSSINFDEKCAQCCICSGDWKSLVWSAEDGKGYCMSCWHAWYGIGAREILDRSERYIGVWEEEWEEVL